MDKISVIVPVYNGRAYLSECIESILAQSYQSFEVIIIDDGSSDGTGDLCDSLSLQYDNVVVVHKENGGLSSARNKGIEVATGKYISFVDSDDKVDKDFLLRLIYPYQCNTRIGLTTCGVYSLNGSIIQEYRPKWHREFSVEYVPEVFIDKMLWGFVSNTVWNKLYLHDLVANLSFKIGRLNEDSLFNFYYLKLLGERGLIIEEISDLLYYYRVNPNGITHSKKTQLLIDQFMNYEEIYLNSKGSSYYETTRVFYTDYLVSLVYYLAGNKKTFPMIKDFDFRLRQVKFLDILKRTGFRNTLNYLLARYTPSLIHHLVKS